MIDRVKLMAERYEVPSAVIQNMVNDHVISDMELNRTSVEILVPEYLEKEGTKMKAIGKVAELLKLKHGTVFNYVYGNARGTSKRVYECKECGCETTHYRYYSRQKMCLSCEKKKGE